MVAHLVRSADFERVLRTRTRISTTHFALHHLPDGPTRFVPRSSNLQRSVGNELSTGASDVDTLPVDDSGLRVPEGLWLGTVVPKRHARRSVTRSLLKRQIRAVVSRHAPRLAPGLWVVRLRAPFDKSRYVSAASDALRAVAREELDGLFDGVVQRMAAGAGFAAPQR